MPSIIDDKANGILLNHDPDWSGTVRVAWYIASERRDPGPTPPSLQECWCHGPDLVTGRFTQLDGPEPPINVITRTVALAVEGYLRHKLEKSFAELHIYRGRL